jgi:autotransporter-associated beta strand protein
LEIQSGDFAGSISGAEGLEKTGSGALTLAGTDTYMGDTDLDGGTLALDNNNALGQGNLTTPGGGILEVGAGLAVTVAGTYAQSAATTLRLTLDGTAPDGWNGLKVGGAAALNGTLQLVPGDGSFFQVHGDESYGILSAANVSGTFSSLVNGISANSVSLVYETNEVLLELTGPTFESLGLTPNEKTVGAFLDKLNGDGGDPALLETLDTLHDSSLPAAYDQLSPSGLTPMFKMRFSNSQAEAGLIGQRLSQIWEIGSLNSQDSAWNGEGVKFAGNLPAMEESQIAQNVQPDRWGVFAVGMGDFGTVASDGNGAGYQYSTGGTMAGMDFRFAKDLVGGLLLGYDQSGSSQSAGTVSVTGGQLGFYAGLKEEAFHLNAMVDGGFDNYSTQRAALGGTAEGSTSGIETTGQLNVGYDLQMDALQISPFASGQFTQVNVNGFTETGSMTPLTFGSQNESYVSSDLGVALSRNWQVGGVQLSPSLSAAWEHVYQGNNDSLTANLGTGNSFTVNGSATGTDGAVLSAGLDARFAKGFNLYADYQGKVGLTNYTEQNLSGGLAVGF